MHTKTLPELSVRISEDQLSSIVSALCSHVFEKYKIAHAFEFNGKCTPDSHFSGDHGEGTRGIKCYLEIKKLSPLDTDPYVALQTSVHGLHIHFNQKDIDEALIAFAIKQPYVPQGANVNLTSRIEWSRHPGANPIVEVIITVSYDDPGEHQ